MHNPVNTSSERAFIGDWAVALVRFMGLAIIGLVWIRLAARELGDAGTGQVLLAVSLAQLLAPVVDAGLPHSITFHVAQEPDREPEITWFAGRAALVLGLVTVPLIGILAVIAALTDVPFGLYAIGLAALVPTLLVMLFAAVQQGAKRFRAHAALLIAPPLLALITTAALESTNELEPIDYVTIWTLSYAVVAVAVLAVSARSSRRPADPTTLRRSLLGYGWKIWVSEAAVSARTRIDLFLVGAFAGNGAAGLYGGASRIAQQVGLVSQAAHFVVFPSIATKDANADQQRQLTTVVARLTGFVALVGAVVVAIFGRQLLRVLLSDEFVDAYDALVWYLPATVFLAVSRVITADLAGRGRPDILAKIALATLGVSVVLNLALIPGLGIEGAAIAASLTALVNLIARLRVFTSISGARWTDVLAPRASDIRAIFGRG